MEERADYLVRTRGASYVAPWTIGNPSVRKMATRAILRQYLLVALAPLLPRLRSHANFHKPWANPPKVCSDSDNCKMLHLDSKPCKGKVARAAVVMAVTAAALSAVFNRVLQLMLTSLTRPPAQNAVSLLPSARSSVISLSRARSTLKA